MYNLKNEYSNYKNVLCKISSEEKKAKIIKNQLGIFTYTDIPKNVYSDSIIIDTSKEYGFLIATKEKAILDMLYKVKTVKSKNDAFDVNKYIKTRCCPILA